MAFDPKTPFVCVDMIVHTSPTSIVLIERRFHPLGIALPGGFVEIGESLETAARRETQEELSCDLCFLEQFKAYGDPGRDPRFHTCSVVFVGQTSTVPKAADDAKAIHMFEIGTPFPPLLFDHEKILKDYVTGFYTQIKQRLG